MEPLVWNKTTGNLVGGHQRLKIMTDMGIEEAEVVVVERDPTSEIALNMALNRIGGRWNMPKLKDLLLDLDQQNFDLKLTGFETSDLKRLIDWEGGSKGHGSAKSFPIPEHPITNKGTLWTLRQHRLLCGDCRSIQDTKRLLDGEKIEVLLVDPPYCSGSFQEAGKAAGTWGEIASDSLSSRGYAALMKDALANIRPKTCYIFTDWRMWTTLFDLVEASGIPVRSMIVWDKGSPGLGGLWRPQHEIVMFGSRQGQKRHSGEAAIGNVLRADRTGNEFHYTEKPVDILEIILKNDRASGRTGLVGDTFAGSGSTILACERLNRPCRAMEVEPGWCDVVVQRWENMTGEKAVSHHA